MSLTPAKKTPQRDFASLARRISIYTTRGILCAAVVIAGIAFGRQVMQWWGVELLPIGGGPDAAAPGALGDSSRSHSIQFGDSPWSLRRESFAGDKLQAARRLQAVCRETLRKVDAGAAIMPVSSAPTPAEARMLASLAGRKPVEESPGKWRLYELHESFPMIVGVQAVSSPPMPKKPGRNLAEEPYRLVLWGIGLPAGPNGWTLCVFEPGGTVAAGGRADVPLPPGCRRTLSVGAAEGGRMTAFTGPEQPEAWKQFYDAWSRKQGWKAVSAWQSAGDVWCAKFASADGRSSLEIRLGPDARGEWGGFLLIEDRRL